MKGYLNTFFKAVEYTDSLGFDTSSIILNTKKKILNEKILNDLYQIFLEEYKVTDEVAHYDCTNVSFQMKEIVADYLNDDVFVTTGSVSRLGGEIFSCKKSYLEHFLKNKFTFGDKLKVHVWLTLSNGEIIDFTIMKNIELMALDRNLPFNQKNIIANSLNIEALDLNYNPVLINDDYYWHIGAVKNIIVG